MKSHSCSIAAGMSFGVSVLIFADGFVFARRASRPYNFPMWLPSIMGLCATFTFLLVRPEHVLRVHTHNPDTEDDYEEIRAKSMVFIGAALFFGALAISVWKLTTPYLDVDAPWPGVALILHSIALIVCNAFLLAARAERPDDTY